MNGGLKQEIATKGYAIVEGVLDAEALLKETGWHQDRGVAREVADESESTNRWDPTAIECA